MANISLLDRIKSYFVFGAQPTEAQFSELIDAAANASLINTGVIDNKHLPNKLDLTHAEQSSVTAERFIGDGQDLSNLNADNLSQGTLANERLPSEIDLTGGDSPSSIRADVMSMGAASIAATLTVHQDVNVTGDISVAGRCSLSRVEISQDLKVAGGIASQSHSLQMGLGNSASKTTKTRLQTQLSEDAMLDVLSFDPQAEKLTMAVKQGGDYVQDEVAGKTWATNQVISAVDDVAMELNSTIVDGLMPQLNELANELEGEMVRAQGAEQQLQGNVDTLAASSTKALQDEVNRAQGAEQQLQGNVDALAASSTKALQAEAKRAKAAEKKLQTNVDTLSASSSTLSSDLQDEVNRAQGAEQQLQDKVDTLAASSTKALQDEVSRAQGAEQQLQDNVDTLAASSTKALQDEVSRAQGAEQQLQGNVDALAASSTKALQAEAKRAKAAEKKLQTNVDTLAASSSTLSDELQQEVDRAQAAEQQIQQSLEEKTLLLEADIKTEQGRVDGLLTTTASYQASQEELVSRVDSLEQNTQQYLDGRVEGSLAIAKSLVPSAGNTAESGINFPGDPGGGSSDRAWIRYYPQSGENTLFEIGTTDNPTDHIVLMGTGNVGVGTRAPTAKFHVAGAALAQAWNISSDARLKTNIKEITHPLTKLWSIRGVYFDWQDTSIKGSQGQQMGVIAQDVEAVFPQAVTTDQGGFKAVDYSKLVAPLIEAVKELSEQLENQAQQIESLKDRMADRG